MTGRTSVPDQRRDVDGILLLDKPRGLSSSRALLQIKRLYRARKAGHTGSLDPLATGMLPVCLGEATKVAAFILESDKVYRFRIEFGTRTATGDREGQVIATGPSCVSEQALQGALERLRGQIRQVPPMHSSLKHQGQRLYRLARAGHVIERDPRIVQIRELEIEQFHPTFPVFRVRCSKGTYIRVLAEDIGRVAATVAHVVELRRLEVCPFPGRAMRTLPELEIAAERGIEALDQELFPTDLALSSCHEERLTPAQEKRLLCGQTLVGVGGMLDGAAGMVRLYSENGFFLGVGRRLEDQRLLPYRLMARPVASTKTSRQAVTALSPRVQYPVD